MSQRTPKELISLNESLYKSLQDQHAKFTQLTQASADQDESIAERQKEIDSMASALDLLSAFKGRSDRDKLMKRIQESAENELRITKEYSEHQAQIKDLETELKKREKENRKLQAKFEAMLTQLERDVSEGKNEKELQHQYNSFLNRANACIRMKRDKVEASLKANECDVSHYEFLTAVLGDAWRDSKVDAPREKKRKSRRRKEKEDPRRKVESSDSDPGSLSESSDLGDLDTSVVIPDCLKTASAAIRQEQISLENRIHRIQEEVSGKSEKMADLDEEIAGLLRQLSQVKMRHRDVIDRMKMTGQVCRITVEPSGGEKKDQGINCRTTLSLDEAKRQIAYNTNNTQKRFLRIQQKGEYEKSLVHLSTQLEIAKKRNKQKVAQKKALIDELLRIVPDSAMRELLGLDIDDVSRKLEHQRCLAEEALQTLDQKLEKAEAKYKSIISRIEDVKYVSNCMRKQIAAKMQPPAGTIRQMCGVLKGRRQQISVLEKRAAFNKIVADNFDRRLAKYEQQFSEDTLNELRANNDNLYAKLHGLKQKFNTLRAIREKRSIPLTNEEELSILQARITELNSELDVFRMRMNSVSSRVDKLVRLVQQADIPVPER